MQVCLPMGWRGLREAAVADTSVPSREPGRRIQVRLATPTSAT